MRKNFDADGIQSLGRMIIEVDKTAEELCSKEDLIYYMHEEYISGLCFKSTSLF